MKNTSLLVLLVGFGALLALIAVAGTIAVGKAKFVGADPGGCQEETQNKKNA